MERSQDEFERISKSIKKEMEMFDSNRLKDFKDCIVKYLEALMSNQQKVSAGIYFYWAISFITAGAN